MSAYEDEAQAYEDMCRQMNELLLAGKEETVTGLSGADWPAAITAFNDWPARRWVDPWAPLMEDF
jgi:hypothetical protein